MPEKPVYAQSSCMKQAACIDLICNSVAILWKDWPKDKPMSSMDQGIFVFNGECPHCQKQSAFPTVTSSYEERDQVDYRTSMVSVACCIACRRYILAIVKAFPTGHSSWKWAYEAHFPLGNPDDTLSDDIPTAVRSDFQEAIRAEWIRAYKATLPMCRRSLQTSCDMEKAVGNDIFTQIDDLATKQKITKPLSE